MEIVVALIAQVFTAGAVWGAIRADVRAMLRDITHAQATANEAHKRIDQLLMRGQGT